mgnify:CR=1 FL=1
MVTLFLRLLLLAIFLPVTGCDATDQPTTSTSSTVLEGKTMGTSWRVSVVGLDNSRRQSLQDKIQARLDADDQLLSTWKTDSALMRFNQMPTTAPWPVSEEMADIVTLALRIGEKTGGAMDITVGPLVNLWGFGPQQQPVKTPTQAQIDAARARTGLQHLTVSNTASRQYL